MAGLAGSSTAGVGKDIVEYLDAVAQFFGITIVVTSGFRSPDGQAHAMFNNWVKLEHGHVYKTSTLPEADRVKLDEFYTTAHKHKAGTKEHEHAKAEFLKLAKDKVGTKSLHTRGRAIDVSRTGIDAGVHRAITLHLQDVKEGKRHDIYHFQSEHPVPPVDEAIKAKWKSIKNGAAAMPHFHKHPGAHFVWC
jgi:hypothetical protein